MKDVSVIIPVFNAEKFLVDCIKSVCNQTFKDIEIILLDDGSTDNSLQICRMMSKYDKRIVVISKENTGVADTRNVGLDCAKGEYIFFCDSDDLLVQDCLMRLISIAQEQNADLVCGKLGRFRNDCYSAEQLSNKLECITYEVLDSVSALNSYGEEDSVCGYIAPKLFSKHIIDQNGLRFNKEIKYIEDTLFSIEYIEHCKKIVSLKDVLYLYRLHDDSSSIKNHNSSTYLENGLNAIDIISSHVKGNSFFSQRILQIRFNSLVELYLVLYLYEKNISKSNMVREELMKVWRTLTSTEIISNKTKIKFNLIRFCPVFLKILKG